MVAPGVQKNMEGTMSFISGTLKAPVTTAFTSGWVIVIWLGWSVDIKAATDPPSTALENCQQASAVSRHSARAGGAVAKRFVDCFHSLLQAEDVLAVQVNQDRIEFVQPPLDLYRKKVSETISLVQQILNGLTAKQLTSFEEIISESGLLDEAAAFGPFLNAPAGLVTDDEKQGALQTGIESFKKILKAVLTAVDVNKGVITLLTDKEGALDELIAALKKTK
jgi:hypothetical protein